MSLWGTFPIPVTTVTNIDTQMPKDPRQQVMAAKDGMAIPELDMEFSDVHTLAGTLLGHEWVIQSGQFFNVFLYNLFESNSMPSLCSPVYPKLPCCYGNTEGAAGSSNTLKVQSWGRSLRQRQPRPACVVHRFTPAEWTS